MLAVHNSNILARIPRHATNLFLTVTSMRTHAEQSLQDTIDTHSDPVWNRRAKELEHAKPVTSCTWQLSKHILNRYLPLILSFIVYIQLKRAITCTLLMFKIYLFIAC